MVTVEDSSMARMNLCVLSISSRPSWSGDIFENSLRSAPAEKVKMFEEAITTARSLPSISAHSSASSLTSCGEIAFVGGRLSQMIPTSPRVSSAMVSRDWPSSGCR